MNRQQRLSEIFLAACELPLEQRDAYLSKACAGDEKIRAEVDSLLAHDDPSSILDSSDFDAASDRPSDRATEIAIPTQVGRYRVERELGRGGYGVVCLATDEQLDRQVAIKLPHRRLVATSDDAEAYLTEARTVAGLDHPHIVPVYDIGSTDQFPCYVVSKFIDGIDLASHLKRGDRATLRRTAELVAIVAAALHYAHKEGLVHRDIKPGNILIDGEGQPHIVDFGLALREENIGKGPRYAGTPAYMSPEQARGEGHRVDGRSDIFSLGAVLYQLLTDRQPFAGDSIFELSEQIITQEVRPPRQCDDQIPVELERICLKSLSKRPSERYLTARDLCDDLNAFLSEYTEMESVTPTFSPSDRTLGTVSADSTNPSTGKGSSDTPKVDSKSSGSLSSGEPIRIVPKGLRSFDEHDADFFLELLPGARDRTGLPDSLRFWKTKIEETNPDKTFSVGLIYGPSGCGKSSLVKAGLLPRLSPSIKTIYLEATADRTESSLLQSLRSQISALGEGLDLRESFAALRQGTGIQVGHKVLVVIDQFEQWLIGHQATEDTELVRTLRQCDGQRVQCIVMVRDDFWMAMTRFMRALEFRLSEGENSVAVDLFQPRHARRVLRAYGRALGDLPETTEQMSTEQNRFVKKAIEGLAENGKIVCVRLALFAEMVKGKPWTPATLKEIGGMEGVGATFLEETFSADTAPPSHRYHQQAARAVLSRLLPDANLKIKGQMQSYENLVRVSGYAKRSDDFDELITILDRELRLITPSENVEGRGTREKSHQGISQSPEHRQGIADGTGNPSVAQPTGGIAEPGKTPDDARIDGSNQPDAQRPPQVTGTSPEILMANTLHPSPSRCYQLTHDYLVPSLRDWLTRKQKETREGRAELRLAERSALWNAKPENRHLPAWWEYGNIRLLTEKQNWNDAQRSMMAKAGRIHGIRWGIGLFVAMAIAITAQQIYASVQRQNASVQRQNLTGRIQTAVAAMSKSRGILVPGAIEDLEDFHQPDMVLDELIRQYDSADESRKLPLAFALAHFGDVRVADLVSRIESSSPDEVDNFVAAFGRSNAESVRALEGEAANAENETKWRYKARMAMLAFRLNAPKLAQEMCQPGPDPTQRSWFIEECSTWHGNLKTLKDQVAGIEDISLRSGIALAVGSVPVAKVSDSEKKAWKSVLSNWFENDPDSLIHSAAGWVIRQWKLTEPKIASTTEPTGKHDWRVNDVGMTLLAIPEGSFVRKTGTENAIDQTVTLASFLLSDREVTQAQFQQFMDDPDADKPDWDGPETLYGPTAQHPVNAVNWYDAVMYCNWLSLREGLTPCYGRTGKKDTASRGGDDNAWRLVPGADGYRLPTEAEWEYACRAGTLTKFSFGDDDDESLLDRYGVVLKSRMEIPGSKLPNGWGVFDAHGNAHEWCHDWYGAYDGEATTIGDPKGPAQGSSRVLRGGAFSLNVRLVRSAFRNYYGPDNRLSYIGFRVARTYR